MKSSSIARSKRKDGGVAMKSAPSRIGNLDAENARHASWTHPNRIASRHRAAHVDHRSGFSPAKLEDQLGCAVDGTIGVGEVDATLEPEPGIGGKTEAASLALNHRGIPECAFEEEARGLAADAAVLAAHDPGKPQRLFFIGD